MKVVFHTNLDEAQGFSWPQMDFPPSVGDLMRACSPIREHAYIELQVVRRTFAQEKNLYWDRFDTVCYCELHLPPTRWKSIADFEAWVQKVKHGQ